MRFARSPCADPSEPSECDRLIAQADVELGPINIYDLYVDVCNKKASSHAQALAVRLHQAGSPLGKLLDRRGDLAGAPGRGQRLGGWWPKKKDPNPKYDPCIGVEVPQYLNRPDVQRALHANVTSLPYPWTECSTVLDYSDDDLMSSMLPVYSWLFRNSPADFRMMVYSGDVDGIVPILGTRTWLRSLDLTEQVEFKPWFTTGSGDAQQYGPQASACLLEKTRLCRPVLVLDRCSLVLAAGLWLHDAVQRAGICVGAQRGAHGPAHTAQARPRPSNQVPGERPSQPSQARPARATEQLGLPALASQPLPFHRTRNFLCIGTFSNRVYLLLLVVHREPLVAGRKAS